MWEAGLIVSFCGLLSALCGSQQCCNHAPATSWCSTCSLWIVVTVALVQVFNACAQLGGSASLRLFVLVLCTKVTIDSP